MGKSTAGALLRDQGFSVIDTDSLAREIVEPGQPALEEMRMIFGSGIIDSSGKLRRGVLAQKVFSETSALEALENILHPRIRALWQAKVQHWREEGRDLGVVIIPLLFETAAESEFDSVICVACSFDSQRDRLAQRGWDARQIEQRLAAQWPIETKMDKADSVIWSDTTLKAFGEQLKRSCGIYSAAKTIFIR